MGANFCDPTILKNGLAFNENFVTLLYSHQTFLFTINSYRTPRTPIDMDRALHTDFTKSETSKGIKTIISPFVYL